MKKNYSQESLDKIKNGRTIYLKSVKVVDFYPHQALKPVKNKKLGKTVTKGKHKGRPIYTLTLEERATCPRSCGHWEDCYGNNMPFAHRLTAGQGLTKKIYAALTAKQKKHERFLVRLHVLGDFYSVDYVEFWAMCLKKFPGLAIWGYTHWHPGTDIGDAIGRLRGEEWGRFAVRFSDLPEDSLSANSEEITTKGVACPEQTGKAKSCADCALCWTMDKPVKFLTH